MAEQLIGHVTHWFGRVNVAGIHLESGELREGDVIHIHGHTSDIEQRVGSMEVEHNVVHEARPGEDISVKVGDHVREHDEVYVVR